MNDLIEIAEIVLFNSKELLLLNGITFKYPIMWENKKIAKNGIAEWSNGFIENFGYYHRIRIDFSKIKNAHDLYETFLHELIHAWQFEKNLEIGHGIEFLNWCVILAELGYNITSEDCNAETLINLQNERLQK